jgi:hypothetical protein
MWTRTLMRRDGTRERVDEGFKGVMPLPFWNQQRPQPERAGSGFVHWHKAGVAARPCLL